MEKFNEVHDFRGVFCNYQKVLEYFNGFYSLLGDSKCDLEFIDTSKFSKCLQYLNHNGFFEIPGTSEKINECGGILHKIFDDLCLKYFKNDLIINKKVEKISEITYLFDSISLLIKILLTKFKYNVFLEHLLVYVNNYFQKYSPRLDNYSEAGEVILQQTLKLFVDILRSLDRIYFSNHISIEYLIQILNSFPFSNKIGVNMFVNYIVPCLFTLTDSTQKNMVLEVIWKKIVMCYKENSNGFKEAYQYTLFCHFTDLIFKERFELENFNIYDNIVWEIIQNGLMSDNSYNRKQVIYAFKRILLLLKSKSDVIGTFTKLSLFSIYTITDLVIWNDLVILFEVLEEKQIHIIMPVLPKFSRILQHASDSDSSNSCIIHPSWITCFIRRMISHESRFVAKQGLSIAMNINFQESQIHELHSEEFIQVLIKGFNDQNMYSRMNENDNLSLFLSSKKIFDFLTEFITTFQSELQKVIFLRNLLKYIAFESWCGIALLHLTFALKNLSKLPSWNGQDIIYLRKIIQGSLKSHEPFIRNAVQYWLIKSCILFLDWNTLSFEDLAELLFLFKSLERHTEIWNAFASKLKEVLIDDNSNNLSIHKAQEFSFNCINKIVSAYSSDQDLNETYLHRMARLLILLDDSLHGNCLNWSHLLQPLTSFLIDAAKRPYMSQASFLNALEFYTLLINTSQGCIRSTNDIQLSAIIKCLNISIEFFEFVCQKSLMNITGSEDIIHFQILYDALFVLLSKDVFYGLFLKLLPSFVGNYYSLPKYFLSKKIILLLYYSISCNQFDDVKSFKLQSNHLNEVSHSLLSIIVDDHVIDHLSKSEFVNEAEKELWQKLVTKSICKFWDVTSCQLINEKNLITALIRQIQGVFDWSSKLTYTSAINCIQTLVPNLGSDNMSLVEDLFNSAWKACSELHGSEAYRPSITSFIGAVFQPYMLNEMYVDILYKYLGCFQSLSENTIGIFYSVVKQFCEAFPLKRLYRTNYYYYIPVLVHSLTYGPIHHKGQKTLEDTVSYIREQDAYFSNEFKNYKKPSMFVRVTVITYLLKSLYDSKSEDKELISLELINSLLDLDKTTRSSKSSKYANSSSHRIRNRIWQAILLLQHNLVTKEINENILKKTLDLLEFESQQPSIRYLQEWVVLKILNDYSCFVEYFLSEFENSLEKRPSFLVSILSILTHLIIHDIHIENHIYQCFPILINYCMAQNFAVRLHGRFAITKLYSFCKTKNFTDIMQKYDFLRSILLSSPSRNVLTEKGNVYKNLLKLQEDFYFSVFNPIKHFTLETIFYDLPRLCNVASEEWIKPEFFKYHLDSKSDFFIPCLNIDSDLKNSVFNSSNDKLVEEPIENKYESFDYNFQKKMCPSKYLVSDYDNDLCSENKPKKTGLIVIASLINKIPNLGGLCRTCEVFGVEEFIIGSMKYTEDKQFQTLAVSADQWVSIKEVKPHHLKEYLFSLKEEGYTIVGAEQTDDSHKLAHFDFPKKSALLLGHEKEGMPVDLIQLLDACVEIPQQGVIRSLNVHVSGAIFIWEYARQQITKST